MMRLLFDASIIAYHIHGKRIGRSGIYFVALNLLHEFAQYANFKISVFTRDSNYLELVQFIQSDTVLHNVEVLDLYHEIPRPFIQRIFIKVICKFCRIIHIKQPAFKVYMGMKDIIVKDYDVFFSPYAAVPKELQKYVQIKKYIVLYDVIPLLLEDYQEDANGWFATLVSSLNQTDHYFAISEYSKQDFLKHIPLLSPSQITVTLLAANDRFCPHLEEQEINSTKQKYNIAATKKYLFSLCSLEPRKNLIMAVKAYIAFISKHNIDDFVFVLGGAAWGGFIEKLESELPDFEMHRDKIIRAGYVADEDLPVLYSGAEFLVYTSQYEGFGLPPLEAMKCGKAVITSNNSSLPEVVGNAGIMIDYDSLEQHVAAYERLYFDLELRKEYEKRSLVRAKEFSWEKTARTMIETMVSNAENQTAI